MKAAAKMGDVRTRGRFSGLPPPEVRTQHELQKVVGAPKELQELQK